MIWAIKLAPHYAAELQPTCTLPPNNHPHTTKSTTPHTSSKWIIESEKLLLQGPSRPLDIMTHKPHRQLNGHRIYTELSDWGIYANFEYQYNAASGEESNEPKSGPGKRPVGKHTTHQGKRHAMAVSIHRAMRRRRPIFRRRI